MLLHTAEEFSQKETDCLSTPKIDNWRSTFAIEGQHVAKFSGFGIIEKRELLECKRITGKTVGE